MEYPLRVLAVHLGEESNEESDEDWKRKNDFHYPIPDRPSHGTSLSGLTRWKISML